MFLKKELVCINDTALYNRQIAILKENGIAYTSKVIDQKSSSIFDNGRGHIDSIGINKNAMYTYYIYVNRQDLDAAKKVLGLF